MDLDRMLSVMLLLTVAAVILALASAPPAREAICHGLTVLPSCAEALRR